MSKQKNTIIIKALIVMILWGTLFPMVKKGFQAYHISTTGDILLFAGIRFTISGMVICAYALARQRQVFLQVKGCLGPVLLSGVFAIILHYSFTYLGLNLTDSSKTALLKQVGVLFYVCFSVLFFKDDRLTVRKLMGVILGFAGIVAINLDGGSISFHLGDVLIIAASFCTVFSNVISKRVFAKVNPIAATGVSQLFGGIVILIVGVVMGGSVQITHSRWILIYICIASVISYCIWYGIVKKEELSKLFIVKFAEPVFAAIFGAVLLGENILRWQYLVAFLLIAGGICISNRRRC